MYFGFLKRSYKNNKSIYIIFKEINSLLFNLLKITLLAVFLLQNVQPILAIEETQDRISAFEDKLAEQFTRKFCNSIGFGISKESALKFSTGENKKEISRKEFLTQMNIKDLEIKIASGVVETCGSPLGLSGQKGIDEFEEFLVNSNQLLYLNNGE